MNTVFQSRYRFLVLFVFLLPVAAVGQQRTTGSALASQPGIRTFQFGQCANGQLSWPLDTSPRPHLGWIYHQPNTDTNSYYGAVDYRHAGLDFYPFAGTETSGIGEPVFALGDGIVTRHGSTWIDIFYPGVGVGKPGVTTYYDPYNTAAGPGVEVYMTHLQGITVGSTVTAHQQIGSLADFVASNGFHIIHVHVSVGVKFGYNDTYLQDVQDPSAVFGMNVNWDNNVRENDDRYLGDWCTSGTTGGNSYVPVDMYPGWNLMGGSPPYIAGDAEAVYNLNGDWQDGRNASWAPFVGLAEWVWSGRTAQVPVQHCTGTVALQLRSYAWHTIGNPCDQPVVLSDQDGSLPVIYLDPSSGNWTYPSTLGPGRASVIGSTRDVIYVRPVGTVGVPGFKRSTSLRRVDQLQAKIGALPSPRSMTLRHAAAPDAE